MKRFPLRRLLALLLLPAMLAVLPGCSKYRVEMSNSRQSETVLTVGGTAVAFEVVDFFYHNYAAAYPEEDFTARMARVENSVCELYAIFAVCQDYGVDPYGKEMNDQMDEAVKQMIDDYPTRRDYIESITAQHMTDAVSRLLLRSYLCEEALLEKLEKELEDDSRLEAFLAREDVLRVLSMTVNFGTQTEAMRQRVETIISELERADDTDAAFLSIARHRATSTQEHTYITAGQWAALCGTNAPAPVKGAFSGPLYDGESCLMMRISEKDVAYAKANRAAVAPGYLECLIADRAVTLTAQVEKTATYLSLSEASFA